MFTAFSLWVRANPELSSSPSRAALSVHDLDFVFHKYLVREKHTGHMMHRNHIMLVEEKIYGAKPSMAQMDTFNALDQALKMANKRKVRVRRGGVTLYYHGLHIVRFECTSPLDGRITWDGREITAEQLTDVLAFKIDAESLKPREDRSHHKSKWYPSFGDWLKPPEVTSGIQ